MAEVANRADRTPRHLAYCGLWALYLLFPDFKSALQTTPYLGGAIELFTRLYVAAVIIWLARQLVFNG
ncbi:hypothetical protein AB4099_12195 [Bosea sp. 2KB_26]|uniref:hypothetical protein n=1 Tax=Bosea sp. 2KB_26 TaxID=3237475 RepID=UPI003F8F18E9